MFDTYVHFFILLHDARGLIPINANRTFIIKLINKTVNAHSLYGWNYLVNTSNTGRNNHWKLERFLSYCKPVYLMSEIIAMSSLSSSNVMINCFGKITI